MALLQNKKSSDSHASSSAVGKIYNFAYRLSGNKNVAGILTEKALLSHGADHNDDIFLLKQAWVGFVNYYASLDFKGEGRTQQVLLALSADMRCAVILCDILGYSYRQIASVLDKPDTAVRVLISRGRREIIKITRETRLKNEA